MMKSLYFASHLSFKVKSQAGDAVGVDVFEDGHRLHSVGVPHADVRLFAHLSCGHQHTLRMQRQTVKSEQSWVSFAICVLALVCRGQTRDLLPQQRALKWDEHIKSVMGRNMKTEGQLDELTWFN